MGMEDDDPLPVNAALLNPSMFVGDVIAGHGVTPFLQAALAAGCKTANGGPHGRSSPRPHGRIHDAENRYTLHKPLSPYSPAWLQSRQPLAAVRQE